MDTSSFEIGQVVQVTPGEIGFDRDWALRRKFGEVVAIDPDQLPHCIQVNMGKNFTGDRFERLTDGVGRFMPSELEVQENGWTPVTRADFIFCLSVNAVFPLAFPWSPKNRCMHEDHTDANAPLAVRRAMVNVWGTVQEIDVCEKHLDQDGRCADDIPYRKPSATEDVIIHPSLDELGRL
ncbi:MAG: hypothetical protein ABIH67_05480 [Candidatus Uhrbacteria bacterium]